MNEFQLKAINKISTELKGVTGDQKAKTVSEPVANALCEFSRQEVEFAEAIVQTDKTLNNCCTEIMKNCGSAISDLEVYKRAVNFYFPGAGVDFVMKINLCASVEGNGDKERGKTLEISLEDLLS